MVIAEWDSAIIKSRSGTPRLLNRGVGLRDYIIAESSIVVFASWCDWLVQRRACLGPVGECLGRIAKTVEKGVTRWGDALPSLFRAMTVLNDDVSANCNSGVF